MPFFRNPIFLALSALFAGSMAASCRDRWRRVAGIDGGELPGSMAASCGKSGTKKASVPGIHEGFYRASGELNTLAFPLIVVRLQAGGVKAYQLANGADGFGTVEFGNGVSMSSYDAKSPLSTAWIAGNTGKFTRVSDTAILMKVSFNDTPVSEYAMQSVSKEEFLASFRAFFATARPDTFSAQAEVLCRGAFDLPCASVY